MAAAVAHPAFSQAAAPTAPPRPDDPSPAFEGTADHVRIVAIERQSATMKDTAVVVVAVDPGYHINANPASEPYLIPTTLDITNRLPMRVIYPVPVPFKPKFSKDVLDVLEGTVRIVAEFAPNSGSSDGRLFGTLTAQACTDQICLPPAELPLPGR